MLRHNQLCVHRTLPSVRHRASRCLGQPQRQFLRHVSHSLPRRRLAPVRATRGRAKSNNQGRHRLRRRGRPELGNSGGTPPRSGDRACTLIDASVGTFASRRAQGPDIAADVAF